MASTIDIYTFANMENAYVKSSSNIGDATADGGNTGADDATSGGTYTGAAASAATYTIEIDAEGSPDTFKWKKDAGAYTTGVAITGSAQTLSDGVTIAFTGTDNHDLADIWTIAVAAGHYAGYPNTYLIDNNPDTCWIQAGSASAYNPSNVVIDLGSSLTSDGVAILLNNYTESWTPSTEIINCYYSDDDVTYTSVSAPTSVNLGDTNARMRLYSFASDASAYPHRYYKIQFTVATVLPRVAGIWLYKKYTMTSGDKWPEDDTDVMHNITTMAGGGRTFVTGINRNRSTRFSRTFLLTGTTEWGYLRDAFNDCAGVRYPLLWNEGTSDIANAKLVRFTHDELSQNQIEHQIYQPTVELEELPYIDDGDTY